MDQSYGVIEKRMDTRMFRTATAISDKFMNNARFVWSDSLALTLAMRSSLVCEPCACYSNPANLGTSSPSPSRVASLSHIASSFIGAWYSVMPLTVRATPHLLHLLHPFQFVRQPRIEIGQADPLPRLLQLLSTVTTPLPMPSRVTLIALANCFDDS